MEYLTQAAPEHSQFFLRMLRIPWEFPGFSMFTEIPDYSRFSKFVITPLTGTFAVRSNADRSEILSSAD